MKGSAVVHQLIHATLSVPTNIEVVSTTGALRLHRRTTTEQRISEVDQDQAMPSYKPIQAINGIHLISRRERYHSGTSISLQTSLAPTHPSSKTPASF